MLAPDRLEALDAFLVDLNRASAGVILPLFRSEHGLEDKNAAAGKAGYDPVTAADKGAEEAIRQLVAQRYPEHGVIGEEHGEDRPDAEFVWVLDPIDGTRAFVAGLPVWTTLIGLRYQGTPVLGSIGQPYVGELYIGHAGGARLMSRGTSRPLKVRKGVAPGDAIIATTDPHACFDARQASAWRKVRDGARLARTGCDAYAYAQVAAGHIDLVIEAGLKSWDIEAAIPVIAGAGGFVTDWAGRSVGQNGGNIAIAGDRAVLDSALESLGVAA